MLMVVRPIFYGGRQTIIGRLKNHRPQGAKESIERPGLNSIYDSPTGFFPVSHL